MSNYDAAITCSFPFTHWALRRPGRSPRPRQIFVTQNGDWPAFSDKSEFRAFRCDGLVCTNPDFADRNQERWNVALIPNGVDDAFRPGPGARERFNLPTTGKIVLMASALIDSKRVLEGIQAVARVPGAHLVVAGDGPLREVVSAAAARALPGRFSSVVVSAAEMPDLYNSADVFLHMSLEESFGNVFVEAMACGLPIVAHGSNRLRWIIGELPTLCDTRDPAAIERALRDALAMQPRVDVDRVERFRWPIIADQYRDFVQSVVQRSR